MSSYLEYFKEICKFPHPSGRNEAINFFLEKFAKENSLYAEKDDYGNVIITKKADKDFENKPAIILQAHSDMVFVSVDNRDKETSVIEPLEENGFLKAKGTSLGADNGIGMAYALSLLSDKDLKTGKLIGLFTSDEEVGMKGAEILDKKYLDARYLINLDSEKEGEAVVSSAGGVNINATFDLSRVKKENEGTVFELELSGLTGGHSGTDIDKNRTSAVEIIIPLAFALLDKYRLDLININMGKTCNVISTSATLKLLLEKSENYESFRNECEKLIYDIKNEYKEKEPNLKITHRFIRSSFTLDERVYNFVKRTVYDFDLKQFLKILALFPQGILERSNKEVCVSSNLGICYVDFNTDKLITSAFLRSNVNEKLVFYKDKILQSLKENKIYNVNADYNTTDFYLPWEKSDNSRLLLITKDTYKKIFNKEISIKSIHAGLECGTIKEKNPSLDIVSIGPNIYNAHTTREMIDIKSADRTFEFLKNLVIALAKITSNSII